jgi:hypothetical protein
MEKAIVMPIVLTYPKSLMVFFRSLSIQIKFSSNHLDFSIKTPCRSYHRFSGKVNRFLPGKSSYLIGFNHYRWWLCHQKALPVDELPVF